MQAYKYRFLLWQFIGASDTGEFDTLSIEEVRKHTNAGTIAAFLVDRFKNFDFSIMDPEDWIILGETWESIANAVDSKRKFGVENRGLSLLMAYTLESIQMLESEVRAA